MNRLSVILATGAVVVSGVAVALAGRPAPAIDRQAPAGTDVALSNQTLVCPESAAKPESKVTLFAVTAPTDATGDDGETVIGTLDAAASEVATLTTPGEAIVRPLGPDTRPAVQVAADGGLAPGLAADQWTFDDTKEAAGLSVAACAAAGDDFWFTGVNTDVGATTRLVLSNPSPAISVVDLGFYSTKGMVRDVGERGIAVAPFSREVLDLAQFAPGLAAATVHVHATRGRVVAALGTALVDGVDLAGTEWIGPSAEPGTDLVVNAPLAEAGSQQLQLTNTSDRQALVKVQVIDVGGPFTPTGFADISVPPGSVHIEDIGAVTERAGVALSVTSNVPVTAATVSTKDKAADFTTSGVGTPLTTPAVVPVIPDTDLSVAFASGSRTSGQVRIEGFSRSGESVGSEQVNLKGFTTTTWEPAARAGSDKGGPKAAYYVVTVTVDAQMSASAQYVGAHGVASLPVTSSATVVQRPGVQSSR